MNDFYQDGIDANAEGMSIEDCPHPHLTSERTQWIRGFKDFQPIRDEWEHNNHERAKTYPD